jgi:hypothetical protein
VVQVTAQSLHQLRARAIGPNAQVTQAIQRLESGPF